MLLSLSPAVAGFCLALGYLFGSIPFGLLLTRMAGTADLRSIGSGNIGATNVLRTGARTSPPRRWCSTPPRRRVAYLAGVWLCARDGAGLAAAAGAFLGHLYPVWLRFRGGKGVATFIGGLIAASWPAALVSRWSGSPSRRRRAIPPRRRWPAASPRRSSPSRSATRDARSCSRCSPRCCGSSIPPTSSGLLRGDGAAHRREGLRWASRATCG